MDNRPLLADVKIITDDSITKIFINDVDIGCNVSRLEYVHDASDIPYLKLDIPINQCVISSHKRCRIMLPEEIADMLENINEVLSQINNTSKST